MRNWPLKLLLAAQRLPQPLPEVTQNKVNQAQTLKIFFFPKGKGFWTFGVWFCLFIWLFSISVLSS